jgi:hypothetical protein
MGDGPQQPVLGDSHALNPTFISPQRGTRSLSPFGITRDTRRTACAPQSPSFDFVTLARRSHPGAEASWAEDCMSTTTRCQPLHRMRVPHLDPRRPPTFLANSENLIN